MGISTWEAQYEEAANAAGDQEAQLAANNGTCGECERAFNDDGLCLDELCGGEVSQ